MLVESATPFDACIGWPRFALALLVVLADGATCGIWTLHGRTVRVVVAGSA